MQRTVFVLLFALALATASTAWAIPPGPCDCASCFLEPDKQCTEWFTLEIWVCRDYSAARCPVASTSGTPPEASGLACPLQES